MFVSYSIVCRSQCAGFDASGKPLDWTCNGTFSKSGCADYGCDWTDIKHPKCTVCSTPQCTLTKTGCDKACVAPPMLFKCNDVTKKCDECASKYCTKDADCPGSYCQITGAGPWSCHGAVPGACTLEQACTSTCGAAAEFYTCDSWNGQCREANASTPGATTKWLCDHGCNRTEPLSCVFFLLSHSPLLPLRLRNCTHFSVRLIFFFYSLSRSLSTQSCTGLGAAWRSRKGSRWERSTLRSLTTGLSTGAPRQAW